MPDITRRSFILTAAAASSAILLGSALTGCGSTGANGPGAAKRLTVAASPTPHAKILSEFAAPKLKDQGIELTVQTSGNLARFPVPETPLTTMPHKFNIISMH